MSETFGPDELIRMAYAATRVLVDRASRILVAEELGVSRFRVARMIEAAEAAGMVQVEVRVPGPIDYRLSAELGHALGLRRVVAVATPSQRPSMIQDYLGRTAAQLLEELVTSVDVLGVTAGRTLTIAAKRVHRLAACDVVQLAGIAGPVHGTALDILRLLTLASGGTAYPLYAPLVLSDPASARAVRSQPNTARTLERVDDITVGLVAIGSWDPPDSQAYDNAAVALRRRASALARGATAEIGAVILDAEGREVTGMGELCIGATAAQLRAIPELIGVAGGPTKVKAVRAAIASGLLDSLVTDTETGRSLLADAANT